MDLSVLIAIGGLLLAVMTFLAGRTTVHKAEGKNNGVIETNLEFIKQSVERIEMQFNRDVNKLEGRLDSADKRISEFGTVANKALDSSKSAHNRLNEHLKREHSIALADWRHPEDEKQ